MGALPTNDELLAAVDAAGWLLEQEALRTLTAADLHPRSGWAFQDPDEPSVSRELDVWAYRELFRDEENKIIVAAKFLVECKQSTQPYAAIGHILPPWRFKLNPTQHVLPVKNFPIRQQENMTTYGAAWDVLGFRKLELELARGSGFFRATQLTRLDRVKGGSWSANNDGVFTSLVYPLAKAIRASQKGQITKEHYLQSDRPRADWVYFDLIFPVVLISSELFVVDGSLDEPSVSQECWVTARRELKSKSVEGEFEFDLVTARAFQAYVNDRLSFASSVAGRIASNPLYFAGDEWTP